MQKNIIVSLVISVALIGGTLFIISDQPMPIQNVTMRDGVQYVTITAGGGYAPQLTEIKGGLPTKLLVKTNGTYDCSASLAVRSVGFQKILQPTGEEVIDLGTPKSGDEIVGVCGMGMYNFQIKVS
jgi:plastocyanin domain-containing protein